MKIFSRIMVLFAIFCGSLWLFGANMRVETYSVQKSIDMGQATFPNVTMLTADKKEINMLYGYSGTIEINNFRDTVMPLDTSNEVTILIRENQVSVKRVNYEVIDIGTKQVLCSESISALENDKEGKLARLRITGDLEAGKEYSLKITLVTDQSKKIHYFSRIKPVNTPFLPEKIAFINEFHKATFDKEKFKKYTGYLEIDRKKVGKSLLDVNLYSKSDDITWGSMAPKVISNVVPTVKEINADTISVQLKYLVSGKIDNPDAGVEGVEEESKRLLEKEATYVVTEFYRIRYTTDRVFLLKWNRSMEALYDFTTFDPKEAIDSNQRYINLGLADSKKTQAVATQDEKKMAFVDHGTLWYYDIGNNKIVNVLTYQDQVSKYYTAAYDSYNMKILDINGTGDINFIVYGYINKGDYEGKVGMILYKYLANEERIEEQMFIPIERPYEVIESEMDGLYYLSELNVFYFSMNNSLYSYNINTRKLTTISGDVTSSSLALSTSGQFVAWQDTSNIKKNQGLNILNLETEQNYRIASEANNNIRLLAMSNTYLIYGYVKKEDIGKMQDDSTVYPMSELYIVDATGKLLKKYKPSKGYVGQAKVLDKSINLVFVKKDGNNVYKQSGSDFIVNPTIQQESEIAIMNVPVATGYEEVRVSLPSNFGKLLLSDRIKAGEGDEAKNALGYKPTVVATKGTLITQDTTVQVQTEDSEEVRYYAYASGSLQGVYKKAADAIKYADDNMGVVVDSNNQIIWERGETDDSAELPGISGVNAESGVSSVGACISMILKYNHISADATEISGKSGSIYELLNENLDYASVNLTGSDLSEVLYYISHKKPVIALTSKSHAVLLTGYSKSSVTYYDPSAKKKVTKGMTEAKKMFETSGNVFISYTK